VIQTIIDRLAPAPPDWTILTSVSGAVSMADVLANQAAIPVEKRPAAFVMLAQERATIGEVDTSKVAQIVEQSVAIAICFGSGDQVGKEVAKDGVTTLRNALLDRLLGWSPDGMGVLTYGGLSMLALKQRAVWFQMIFGRRVGVTS
jgi:hypothetical protein